MIEIKPLQNNHLQDITSIADMEFGEGFIPYEQLLMWQNDNQNSFIRVIECNNNVVAFSISLFLQNRTFKNIFGEQVCKIPNVFFDDKNQIGLIKTIVVQKEFRGRHYGTLLCEDSFNLLKEKGSKSIIGFAWKQNNCIPAEKMFLEAGLLQICDLPNFWQEESITKKYNCSICGNPPCNCTAVFFGKSFEEIKRI